MSITYRDIFFFLEVKIVKKGLFERITRFNYHRIVNSEIIQSYFPSFNKLSFKMFTTWKMLLANLNLLVYFHRSIDRAINKFLFASSRSRWHEEWWCQKLNRILLCASLFFISLFCYRECATYRKIYVMMFNSLQAHKLEISSVDGVRAVVREFSTSMRDAKDEKYVFKKNQASRRQKFHFKITKNRDNNTTTLFESDSLHPLLRLLSSIKHIDRMH